MFGGNAGGRAAALDFNENNRRFDHAGHADGLGHQGKTAAGGGAHSAGTGKACSDRHVGNRELVLHLLDDDAAALGMFRHPSEDARCGRHGICGVKSAAGCDGAHAERFVSSDVGTALAGKIPFVAERDEVLFGVFVTRFQNAHVLVDDGFALMAESIRKHARRNRKIEAEKEDEGADGDSILHNRGDRRERLRQLTHGKRNGEDIVANRDIDLELVGIEQDRAARFDFRGVALDGILIERNEGVQMVALGIGSFLAQAQAQPDVAAANH